MQKVACVFSFKKSSWISCQKIVFNLHKAWDLNPDFELLNYNYSQESGATELAQTAQEIFKQRPALLVILDHKPHPFLFLQTLFKLYGQNPKPRIVFHIFGDFTLYYQDWEKLAPLLLGCQVDFVVASPRQKILLDKMLAPGHSARVCPFPVDPREFHFDPKDRAPQRKAWGIKDSERAFVFTGRLTRQKRIHSLIRAFADVLGEQKIPTAHLFLYGNSDNIGDPFLGIWESQGEYFRKIDRIYQELPGKVRERIHFMGNVPNEELRAVYQAADVLVNLSVHNDEDFGMSVAEAQASGLPCILSDWGGLAGFELPQVAGATCYVGVKIGKRSKVISLADTRRCLRSHLDPGTKLDRRKISQLALQRHGIEAAHRKIEEILREKQAPFAKFSPLLDRIAYKSKLTSTLYVNQSREITNLYREIYSSYVRNS